MTEIQRIVRKYFKQLHDKKRGNLEKMEKFLLIYNIQKLNQEDS